MVGRHKVGDKVQVRTKESLPIIRGIHWDGKDKSLVLIQDMCKYTGKIVTIKSITDGPMKSDFKPYYKIEEDNGMFMWQDWMLENVQTEDIW